MMHLGAVFGGPGGMDSHVGRAISKIKRLRGEYAPTTMQSRSGSLDIVFHVPGSIAQPEYEGIRTGSLSRKRRLLQVQVAVPQELNAKQPEEIERFLSRSIRQAIELAEPVFMKAKIPFERTEHERILQRIERALSPN